MKKISIALAVILSIVNHNLNAQCYKGADGKLYGLNGGPCVNTVVTAVPFLRISPDARSGAMGDAAIAITPDANSMHFNASNLAFSSEDLGVSATYTPWLSGLGINDIYLAYASAFKKINKRQTVGASIKFFSLGEINFTDENGSPLGTGNPNELEADLAFVQLLSPKLSFGVTGKFIYSNLASGQTINQTVPIKSGKAGAGDISLTYKTQVKTGRGKDDFTIGLALTNIGSKITYTSSINKDYLPANLGLGASYKMKINEYNTIAFALDINKLMVPTPVVKKLDNGQLNPDYDINPKDGVADYRQKGLVSSILTSFRDAPPSEEFKEYSFSLGAEYWYANQFALRGGYFHEDKLKGGRRYLTLGLGLKYNIFGLNFSYLVPTTNQRNPLDNTLRFSLLFDFGAMKSTEE